MNFVCRGFNRNCLISGPLVNQRVVYGQPPDSGRERQTSSILNIGSARAKRGVAGCTGVKNSSTVEVAHAIIGLEPQIVMY
jgi:hypothetical protein